MVNDHLSIDWGGRLTSETVGRAAAFCPRVALLFLRGKTRKLSFALAAGLFYDPCFLLEAELRSQSAAGP